MKNLLFAASAVLMCGLISCSNNSGGMSAKAKKNLETSQAVAKMFESGDWSKTKDYIAADAVEHATMDGKDIKGVDNIKANFDKMGTMMSDFKNDVMQEVANDDYTFQWMKESATAKVDDPMMGKAGTRKTFNCIEVAKFNADGKITEHWSFIDWNDMIKMMPQPGTMNNNMMDTTKMKPTK